MRIDAHGSKDRAKDASSRAGTWVLGRVHTLCGACATAFPSSATSGHPLSPARAHHGGIPEVERRTDRDPRFDDAPRRAPPSRGPGCLRPSRHVEERFAEGSLPPASTPALSLTPPALVPLTGSVLWMGIARSRCGHPRVRDLESTDAFSTRADCSCLGLTTQARRRARSVRPSTRTDCLARIDPDRSA